MKTSDDGFRLIKKFEGLVLRAYRDSVGIWTIGYGHIRHVKPGDTITAEEADALLRGDVQDSEDCVNELAPDLGQGQFDACVSFVFNLGCMQFENSTLLKFIRKGDMRAAADQFLRWDHAGGKTLPGLTKRREAERELFLRGLSP